MPILNPDFRKKRITVTRAHADELLRGLIERARATATLGPAAFSVSLRGTTTIAPIPPHTLVFSIGVTGWILLQFPRLLPKSPSTHNERRAFEQCCAN